MNCDFVVNCDERNVSMINSTKFYSIDLVA